MPLSTLEPRKRHHDVRSGRLTGTGEWLLEVEAFRIWRDSNASNALKDRFLCSYGMPGAGKTVMRSVTALFARQICDPVSSKTNWLGIAHLLLTISSHNSGMTTQ